MPKKTRIQEMIEAQAKTMENKPLSKEAIEFAKWFEFWEQNIKGKSKEKINSCEEK